MTIIKRIVAVKQVITRVKQGTGYRKRERHVLSSGNNGIEAIYIGNANCSKQREK
jgi:hypothetical protein